MRAGNSREGGTTGECIITDTLHIRAGNIRETLIITECIITDTCHITRNCIECSVPAEECMQHNSGGIFFKQHEKIGIVVRIGFGNFNPG